MTTHLPIHTVLAQMPSLAELFRLFLSGHHLNRSTEPGLWAELEQNDSTYITLFAALGFDLRLDARGFAWFHNQDSSSNIGKVSRQLALLFMVIFETHANAGKALQRFSDWIIDKEFLLEMYKQHQEMLDAEGLNPDNIADLMNRASTLGFAKLEAIGWQLLPAVCRYLDHFEALANSFNNNKDDDWEVDSDNPDTIDESDDEEAY